MDYKARGVGSKRIFGKDITNLDRRNKNNSISEKVTQLPEVRVKSKSTIFKPLIEIKDPICEYQQDILHFILGMQVMNGLEQKKEKKELMQHINEDMRMILIDWLVDVHSSFDLKDQTLYLALCYLNEYTSTRQTTKYQYQLVGITCLWIASKYEEIYPPRMQNYVQVTDSSYTAHQMKEMEGKIILALNFNLTYTTPLQILETVSEKWSKDHISSKLTKQSLRTLNMCKYLIELSLFEGLSREYCMRTLVLTAIMLSDSIFKVKTESKMLQNQKMQKETIMKSFKQMCIVLQNASKTSSKMKAIKSKYNNQKYMCVAKFRIEAK